MENWLAEKAEIPEYLFVNLEESEHVVCAAYLLPRGLGLFVIDPISGLSTGPFANPLHFDLLNHDPELFKSSGVQSVTRNAFQADRVLCDMNVLESMRRMTIEGSECVLVVRILVPQPGAKEYRWIRQWTPARWLPSESISLTCLAEKFEVGALRILETLKEDRSLLMLASLAMKAYDCCLLVDAKFRIISDSPEGRKWIYGDTNRSLVLTPLESMVPLDQNKLALRQHLKSNEKEPIVIRVNRARKDLTEVKLVSILIGKITTPNQDLIPEEAVWLVGMAKIGSAEKKSKSSTLSSPPKRMEPSFQIPLLMSTNRSPPFPMMGEVYRDIFRDWKASIENPLVVNGWMVPIRRVASPEAISDFILMSLPHHLQTDFMSAANRGQFNHCAQLLSFTVFGNANIMSLRSLKLTDNTDLIHCVFRFFLNMVPRMHAEPGRQFSLLYSLNESRKQLLSHRLDAGCFTSMTFRFMLALLSTAIVHPDYYSTQFGLKWLRTCFKEVFELLMGTRQTKSSYLLVVQWICLLWAGTMRAMADQTEEADAVLHRLKRDVEQFLEIHPMSIIANQQLMVILWNLKEDPQNVSHILTLIDHKYPNFSF